MKRTLIHMLTLFWLGNLSGQNWVNVIDSMPNSRKFFYSNVIDSVNHVMYIGGDFQQINNLKTKSIIKYNGITFDTLGAGIDPQWAGMFTPSIIKKAIMFQGKLYVTGTFEKAGKYYSHNIARWNGSDWDSINFKLNGTAWCMQVYNNELYIGGLFDSIAGIKCNNFAKYDGTTWHSISYGYNTCVSALEIFNGKLYMSGEVSSGSSCANLAYFDGTIWKPFVGVLGDVNKTVWGMKTIDTMLYVYGRFYGIGGIQCNGLAAWNGSKWFDYGFGVNKAGTICDVNVFNNDLYISGIFDSINSISTNNGVFNFQTNVAKFSSNRWCTFLEPLNNAVAFTTDFNNELYIGGAFLELGNHTPSFPLIKWTGGNSTISCGAFVDVGIFEIAITENIKLYPNPTTGTINIYDEQNDLTDTELEITNPLGQIVLDIPFSSQIDISALSKGLYYLTIKSNSIQKTIKIVRE